MILDLLAKTTHSSHKTDFMLIILSAWGVNLMSYESQGSRFLFHVETNSVLN